MTRAPLLVSLLALGTIACAPDATDGPWEGTLEDRSLASGSQHFTLWLDPPTSSGDVGGVLVFGDAPVPPPATDPNVAYPPGFRARPSASPGMDPIEGVPYPITHGSVAGSHVRVTIALGSTWVGWCALQTPVAWPGGSFECLPNAGFEHSETVCTLRPEDGPPTPVDCGVLDLCLLSRVCACDVAGCSAQVGTELTLDFDVGGDNALGTIDWVGSTNVRLMR